MANFNFYRLSNGVRVVLVPMSGVESVAIGVYATVGSRYETAENAGTSHFLEHLVFKGTRKYPTPAATSSLESLGAMQNAWTDVDATAYYCKIPADHFEAGLDLISDLVLNPLIPKKDLEIEKGVILEEINRRQDQPDELVWEKFHNQMFSDHPLGRSILGTPAVISASTSEKVLKFHADHYTSDSLIVVIAGKIPSGHKEIIENLFGNLPKGNNTKSQEFINKSGKKINLVKRPKDNQIHLVLGGYAVNAFDMDRYTQNILMTVLGSGMSSRLFLELREKWGLCYAVSAGEEKYADTGYWSVYAGVATDKLRSAILGIKQELEKLVKTPVSEAELSSAKQRLRGRIIFSQEDPMRQMEYYVAQVITRDDQVFDYQENLKRLMAVTAKQVQQHAAKIFAKDNQYLTVLGPIEDKMLK